MKRAEIEPPTRSISVVYDGECPVCQHFVKGIRLKQLTLSLHLINARDPHHPSVERLAKKGIKLNDNMAVLVDEQILLGADAITWLTAVTTPSHRVNTGLFWLFRTPVMGKALYPILRGCRWLLLRVLRRPKL